MEQKCGNTSINNSIFITDNSCCIKEETDTFLNSDTFLLSSIKEEIDTYQNYDDNQSLHNEE